MYTEQYVHTNTNKDGYIREYIGTHNTYMCMYMSTSDCVCVSAACSKPEKTHEWKAAAERVGSKKLLRLIGAKQAFLLLYLFWVAASQ